MWEPIFGFWSNIGAPFKFKMKSFASSSNDFGKIPLIVWNNNVYHDLQCHFLCSQVQHFFDDPEGKIELPPMIKVDHWKRPQDFITDKVIET